MWPLSYFESNQNAIGEVDNPVTWDGYLFFIITAIIFIIVTNILYNRMAAKTKPLYLDIINYAIIISFIVFFTFFLKALFFYLFFIFVLARFLVILIRIIGSSLDKRNKFKFIGITIICFFIAFTGFIYAISTWLYFLPASYPPNQRDQLRMVRRIIEIQPKENELKKPFIPLSKAHLVKNDKDLIPDSIRANSEYQGYTYILKSDNPTTGLYTLDAIPIEYKRGMASYHAFPVNPEDQYVIYCITMADKKGQPATEKDRHFHMRSLWYWLFGK